MAILISGLRLKIIEFKRVYYVPYLNLYIWPKSLSTTGLHPNAYIHYIQKPGPITPFFGHLLSNCCLKPPKNKIKSIRYNESFNVLPNYIGVGFLWQLPNFNFQNLKRNWKLHFIKLDCFSFVSSTLIDYTPSLNIYYFTKYGHWIQTSCPPKVGAI